MGDFEDVKADLKKAIETLSKAEEFDPTLMKKIKNICKKNDGNVCLAQKLLFVQLRKNHSVVRLNCIHIIDQLFQRSHSFRNLVIDDFQTYVDLTLGSDPSKPLPPPVSQNKKLRRETIRTIKEWHLKFGEGYKKLRLSYNFLKQIVDFDDLSLIRDEDRLKRIERQEKLERIWIERIRKVSEEVVEYEVDIENWFTRTNNLFEVLDSNRDPVVIDSYSEEISGQYNILDRRLLPKTKAWIVTLTKAGNSTDHDLMRKVIDLKNRLASILTKFNALNIDYNKFCNEVVNEDIKVEKLELSIDPTTWGATVKKVTGEDLNLNLELEDKCVKSERDVVLTSSPGGSGTSSVPKVRLEDLTEPDKMIVDPEKSRFWVSDHREGQVLSVGSTQRISHFIGTSEPVQWTCRAKLASGKLCPRMDRVKCPLHGVIVARDDTGEEVNKHIDKINFDNAAKFKGGKRKGLKSAHKWDETTRTRIEKKIFNRGSAKRAEVAKDLKQYDKIRTKDKFVDQFNY